MDEAVRSLEKELAYIFRELAPTHCGREFKAR